MRTTKTLILALTFGVACGGGGGGDDGTVADAPPGTPDGMAGMIVPDPGNGAIPFSWPDTEPNDTASHAVPIGTSTSNGEAIWFDGSPTSGQLGGADREDFFVFRSSPQGGNFHAAPCWDGVAAPNLMDLFVYKVVGGQVGAMVGSSTNPDSACENQTGAADVAMEASTVYLLEFKAMGTGTATYGA